MTRDDVTTSLGQVDDAAIAEIIATGATAGELAEAHAWIANDEPLMNAGRPLPSGRIGQLVEMLTALEPDEDDATEPGPSAGPT